MATTNKNFKVKNGLDAGGVITSTGLTITGTLAHSGASSPISLNNQVGTSGQVLTSAGSGATPTWTDPFVLGALDYVSGAYYSTPIVGTKSTQTAGIGDTYLTPFIAGKSITFTKLACYVSSGVSGSSVVLGVYNSTSTGFPNSLITSSSITTATSTSKIITGLSIPLTKGGLYWLAILNLGTTTGPTLRSFSQSPIFTTYDHPTSISSTTTPVAYYAASLSSLPATWSSTTTIGTASVVWLGY